MNESDLSSDGSRQNRAFVPRCVWRLAETRRPEPAPPPAVADDLVRVVADIRRAQAQAAELRNRVIHAAPAVQEGLQRRATQVKQYLEHMAETERVLSHAFWRK